MPRLTTVRLTQAQRDANEAREARGQNTIGNYIELHTGTYDEEPYQEILTDLLADLRHWAAAEKLDFDRALATSQIHFNCERPIDTDLPWYCPDCERAMEADQPTKEDR